MIASSFPAMSTPKRTRLPSLFLPFALLLAGSSFAQGTCTVVTDTPPCIGEVRLDSPNMNVTGQSVTPVPGEDLVFTAQAYTGTSTQGGRAPTDCNAWQFQVFDNNGNPVPFEQSGATGRIVIPAANVLTNGIGRTEAVCLDNPSIGTRSTIQAPLAMPVAPPPPLAGEAAMAAERSGSLAAPGSGAGLAGKRGAAGGGGNGAGVALVIGGVIVAGAAIGLAVSAASEVGTSSSGSGGWYADWTCTSSQCASVMGAWSGSAGPFSTQTECISWTQTQILAPCNYR